MIVFGIAFGYVEAAVVVYLRELGNPIRVRAGLSANEIFPLLSLSQMGQQIKLVKIELAREVATLAMLSAVAWCRAQNKLAAFCVAFGAWDLAFYGWLRVLTGWPPSSNTWDLLFLVPVPWAAPVLAPSIVALSMVIGGAVALLRGPVRTPWPSWVLLLAGTGFLLISFMWDWRYWVDGGMPRTFPWSIFAVGEVLAVAGFLASQFKRYSLRER